MSKYIAPQTKYCEEIKNDICKFIEEGNTYEDSAVLAGVSRSSFYSWYTEKHKLFHKDFKEAVIKSEIICKRRNINVIQRASYKSWTAAAWYLERRYSDEYALKNINEHTGKNGQPIQFNVIAGGYIPQSKEVEMASERHNISAQSEVQDNNLAQKSEKDYNGNSGDSATGNA